VGTCRIEKTQLLFLESLQGCKIGVGFENWSLQREELLILQWKKTMTTAQGSVPLQSDLESGGRNENTGP
jgi:hypothetical protein